MRRSCHQATSRPILKLPRRVVGRFLQIVGVLDSRVKEETVLTLPAGTCVFSNVARQMPLKIDVKPLDVVAQPKSMTRKFEDIVPLVGE